MSKKILFKNLVALLVTGTLGSFFIFVIIGLMIYAPPFRIFSIVAFAVAMLMWAIVRVCDMVAHWKYFMSGKKSLKKLLTEAD
jgi:hypothetical protein